MKLYTTLELLRKNEACKLGYRKLLSNLGKDYDKEAPIDLLNVLESNGLANTLWCLRATTEDSKKITVDFAVFCAEQVLPIFEAKYPDDDRPRKAIEAAKNSSAASAAASAAYAAASAAYAADARDVEKAKQIAYLKELLS